MGEIENSFVIFVLATYGEGDPTDNAREFFEWLEGEQEDLQSLKYAVRVHANIKLTKSLDKFRVTRAHY